MRELSYIIGLVILSIVTSVICRQGERTKPVGEVQFKTSYQALDYAPCSDYYGQSPEIVYGSYYGQGLFDQGYATYGDSAYSSYPSYYPYPYSQYPYPTGYLGGSVSASNIPTDIIDVDYTSFGLSGQTTFGNVPVEYIDVDVNGNRIPTGKVYKKPRVEVTSHSSHGNIQPIVRTETQVVRAKPISATITGSSDGSKPVTLSYINGEKVEESQVISSEIADNEDENENDNEDEEKDTSSWSD